MTDFRFLYKFHSTSNSDSWSLYYPKENRTSYNYFYSFIHVGYELNSPGYYLERNNGTSYMLTYTISGEAEITYGGKTFKVQAGDLCMINLAQKSIIRTVDNYSWEIYFSHLTGGNTAEFYNHFVEKYGHVMHGYNPEILICNFNEIKKSFDEGSQTHASISKLIYDVIMDVSQNYLLSSNNNPIISKAIDYILQNYNDKITVETLSNLTNYSKRQFIRKFTEATGQSPKKYLTDFRLYKARELLSSTNLSITQIACMCGFENAKNMHYSFVNAYDVSPEMFRKAKKENIDADGSFIINENTTK